MKNKLILSIVLLILSVSVCNGQKTFLLVTSSSSKLSNIADYICDGVDDQIEIQQALDSSVTAGYKSVYIDGTFEFSDTLHIKGSYDDLTLSGYGWNRSVVHANNPVYIPFISFKPEYIYGFTIKDIYFDGSDKTGNTSGNWRGLITALDGVIAKNITIKGCKIVLRGNYNTGISFSFKDSNVDSRFSWLTLDGNTIFANAEGSTGMYGFRITMNNEFTIIHNNTIEILNPSGGANNFNALSLYGSAKKFSIKNNFILTQGQCHSPISVSPGSKGTIVGNYVEFDDTYTYEGGIEVEWKAQHTLDIMDSVNYVTVVGNSIKCRKNNGVGGRWSSGILVRIYDSSDSVYPTGITIVGNVISNADYGLRIEDGRNITYSSNSYINCGKDIYLGRTDQTPPTTKLSKTYINSISLYRNKMYFLDTTLRDFVEVYKRDLYKDTWSKQIVVDENKHKVMIGLDTPDVEINGKIRVTGLARSVVIGENAAQDMDLTQNRNNFYLGYQVGRFTGTSIYNVGIGTFALSGANFNSSYNTAIGGLSQYATSTGGFNNSIGYQSLYVNTLGSYNVAVGHRSGYLLNGNRNVCIGAGSGRSSNGQVNVDDCVFIGYNTGNDNAISDVLIIGNKNNSKLIFGEFTKGFVTINSVLKLNKLSSSPTPASDGMLYYSTDGNLYLRTSGVWKKLLTN